MFYVILCHSDQSEESTIFTWQQWVGLFYLPVRNKSKQHSLTPPLPIKLSWALWSSHKSFVFEYKSSVLSYGTSVFKYGALVFEYEPSVLEYEALVS